MNNHSIAAVEDNYSPAALNYLTCVGYWMVMREVRPKFQGRSTCKQPGGKGQGELGWLAYARLRSQSIPRSIGLLLLLLLPPPLAGGFTA